MKPANASRIDICALCFASNCIVTPRMLLSSQLQSFSSVLATNSPSDLSLAFMASLHWPQMTAWIASRFPRRILRLFPRSFRSSFQSSLSPSSASGPGSGGFSRKGRLGSAANSVMRSSGFFIAFRTCPSKASTVLEYWRLSLCSL